MKTHRRAALILAVPALLFCAAAVHSDEAAVSASQPPREVLRRNIHLGLQMSSDAILGLLFCSNRIELCAKAQVVAYDGFLANVKPDDMLMIGGHAAFLFRPSDNVDLGIGADVRGGIALSGSTVYRQYLDAGLRTAFNYHLGDRIMISGVLYPLWIAVRETDAVDSYQLAVRIPSAAAAVSLFF